MPEGARLNKFLASCGIGSRRACDALIQRGGITINGESCDNPATRVQEDDVVRLEGKRVSPRQTATILFKKPRGYVCSKQDELGRATIYELLPPKFQHLNHVGRLDRDSEGLLILTNDGDLANRLTHPSNKVEKEYRVTLTSAVEIPFCRNWCPGFRPRKGTPVRNPLNDSLPAVFPSSSKLVSSARFVRCSGPWATRSKSSSASGSAVSPTRSWPWGDGATWSDTRQTC